MTDPAPAETAAPATATPSPATGTAPAATSNPQPAQAPNAQSSTATTEPRAAVPAPAETGEYTIPEAYKDKPWASKIKSADDLWKQIDNLQGVVGKKNPVPDFATATPQQIDEFKAQLRPADKAEYAKALALPDTIPEADRALYTDLLHNAGVRAPDAQEVVTKFSAAIEAQKLALTSEDGFKAELKTRFGDDYKEPVGELARIIKPHLNAEDAKVFDSLPNQYLGLFYGLLDKVVKDYGVQEGGAASARPNGNPGVNIDAQIAAVNAKIRDLSNQPFHTQQQKTELINELTKLTEAKIRGSKSR